jgi:intracellular septation protein
VVNWLFAGVFLGSQFVGKKTLVERFMGANITLPALVWGRLNLSWTTFFVFLGLANLYVVYNFDTETWVNFKLFGMLGLTVLFILGQGLYLSRYMKDDKAEGGS